MLLLVIAAMILPLLSACSEEIETQPKEQDTRVVGTWVLSKHYDDGFSEKDYIYIFHENGALDFYSGDEWARYYADYSVAGGRMSMTVRESGLSQNYWFSVENGTMKLTSENDSLKFIQISSEPLELETISGLY